MVSVSPAAIDCPRSRATNVYMSTVESVNRSSGLQVTNLSQPLQVGKLYDIAGRMYTDGNGERCLRAWQVSQGADGPVDPLAMPVRSLGGGGWQYDPANGGGQQGILGGAGLNNIGLLVKAVGKVVECQPLASPPYLLLDDGSSLPIKVICQTAPTCSEYAAVTGISSCTWQSGNLVSVILATGIQPI